MRKNKLLYIILVMCLFANQVSAANGASPWAVDEVEKAEQNRLVPEDLLSAYQTDITRSEYVVLALKAYARDGNLVQILKPFPFSDIDGHKYEDEIVKAYNAGLINGYGDGTFRPDAKITRQEIAVLMLNLVKAVNPDKETFIAEDYDYDEYIAVWARDGLDYCYHNGIIKGVGKAQSGLDKIQPQGFATREQAMIMVYRLAGAEGVLAKYNLGTVTLTRESDEVTTTEQSDAINDFAQTFGEALALKMIKYNNSGAKITDINEHFAEMEFSDGTKVSMAYVTEVYQFNLSVYEGLSQESVTKVVDLMASYGNKSEIQSKFAQYLGELQAADQYSLVLDIGDDDTLTFTAATEDLVEVRTYRKIVFEHKVFK